MAAGLSFGVGGGDGYGHAIDVLGIFLTEAWPGLNKMRSKEWR